MAQNREKGGRVVFIGNIPYGVSEEQIIEIFSRIGNVLSFRLVYDKETGKPKGFGFLEYPDVDSAAAAVRNLNNHEIMGRSLKVDYSNDNGGGAGNRQNDAGNRAANTQFDGPPHANGVGDPNALPPLPPGTAPPPSLGAPDAISQTLAAMPASQLVDILSQMKSLASTEPLKATAILQQAPQLSYAIFQALLLLGLVDTTALGQLVQPTAQAQPQPPPPMPYQQQPPPMQQQQYPPPQFAQPTQYTAPPQHYGYAPTPPVHQPPYQPPPPPASDANQAALLQQVMTMTPEMMYQLPETARQQINALRVQYGAQPL